MSPDDYLALIDAFLAGRSSPREFACAVEDLWVGAEPGATPWLDEDAELEEALWALASVASQEFELDLLDAAAQERFLREFAGELRRAATAARQRLLARADSAGTTERG